LLQVKLERKENFTIFYNVKTRNFLTRFNIRLHLTDQFLMHVFESKIDVFRS